MFWDEKPKNASAAITFPGRGPPFPIPASAAGPCYTPSMTGPGDVPDDPPPFLRTWRRVYAAVLIYLAALVAGSYLFTRAYR